MAFGALAFPASQLLDHRDIFNVLEAADHIFLDLMPGAPDREDGEIRQDLRRRDRHVFRFQL